jgi:peptidoglycan/LPS O-acetylase OafA/YrhL
MRANAHIPALDGIRAAAILLVVPHNTDIYGAHPGLFFPMAVMAHLGWIGVQLFFVLSGFLITAGLLDTVHTEGYLRNFYLRRVLRILPLYYLVLLIGLVVLPALLMTPRTDLERQGEPWLWLFLSNWVQPFGRGVTGLSHFWSLAVEEQFYLVWPLVVLRWQGRALLRVAVTLTIVAIASRAALIAAHAPSDAIYMFTFCRMDALALGASAAVLAREEQAMAWLAGRANRLLITALALLVLQAFVARGFGLDRVATQLFGYSLIAVSFALAILAVAVNHAQARTTWIDRLLSSRPLRSIGRYSYGMYVLHLPLTFLLSGPILNALAGLGTAEPPLYALIFTVISYAAGWASYLLVERRFLQLKSRLTSGKDERLVREAPV